MPKIRPFTIQHSAKIDKKTQGHRFNFILESMDFIKYRNIYTKWDTKPNTFIWCIVFFFCENHTIQNLPQNEAIAFYYRFVPYIKQ